MIKSMLKYLIFDLDNTLYSSRYGLEDRVHRRMREFSAAFLGLSPDEAWQQRTAQKRRYGTNLEWLMAEKGFTDVEAYIAAVHPPDEASALPPDPELGALLEGIPVPKAVLTNSPMEHAIRILDRLGIAGCFTHIFDIRQNGFRGKPQPEVYRRTLGILGAAAADTLFIDDYPLYTEAFIALGGRGLLIDENGVYGDYPGPKIRALRELPGYII